MIAKLPPKTTSITEMSITEMSIADIGGDDLFCPRMWAGMTFCFVVTLVVITATGVAIEDKRSQYRQPAAILLDSGDTALVVANKNSGSISTVLLSHGEVQEYPLGKSLREKTVLIITVKRGDRLFQSAGHSKNLPNPTSLPLLRG